MKVEIPDEIVKRLFKDKGEVVTWIGETLADIVCSEELDEYTQELLLRLLDNIRVIE